MTRFYDEFTTWREKRTRYLRTRDALRAMPLNVAIDLGLFHEDAARNAARAVYGPRG